MIRSATQPYDRHRVAEVGCVVGGDRCRAASGARAVVGSALRARLPSDDRECCRRFDRDEGRRSGATAVGH